ncbi:MAG: hypothetical protein GC192_13500 [Bacteroidetes bacterium]|nr:hypothetical protein [Bacteroidota bacterium]
MKKQFITIVCTLVAIISNINNSNAQELAINTASPFSSLHNLLLWSEPTVDPVNAEPTSSLDISGQNLTEIPSEVFSSDAEVITLDSNLLNELPATIGQWSSCRQLYVRHNWLMVFPESASKMPSLELMDLTRNQIDHLPASVGKLESMKKLVLDLNFLNSLPAEIGQMKSLKELSVRWNALTKLPVPIAQLENLEVLNLTNNSLSELPEEICNMKNLKVLRVNFNNIQSLPKSLGNLAGSLKILDLSHNPMGRQWISEVKAMLPNTQVIF